MVEIQIEYPAIIYLEDPIITGEETFKSYFTILNEMGDPVSDINNERLEHKECLYNAERKSFYTKFQLSPDNKGKYYRCCFEPYKIVGDNDIYFVSEFALVDFVVNKLGGNIQLVPYEYFRDYVVNGELSDDLKEILLKYPKDAFKEWLSSSVGELEHDLELCITKKTVENEAHDFYCDNLREIHFLQQTYESPIISVEDMSLWYGKEKICALPTEELLIDKIMGTIEFLPTANSPFFVVYQAGLEASQIALFSRGLGSYSLPHVFRLSYTHGIDYMNLERHEQSEIRMAICRRALLKGLARISPEIVTGSESQAVDGVSYSKGYAGIQYMSILMELERKWISDMKRKYNKHTKLIIA